MESIQMTWLGLEFRMSDRRGVITMIPQLHRFYYKAQTLYDNSFRVLGSRRWNILPANITLMSCFETFKMNVDKFLSQFPDKPPIQGYPYITDNSLLSY